MNQFLKMLRERERGMKGRKRFREDEKRALGVIMEKNGRKGGVKKGIERVWRIG